MSTIVVADSSPLNVMIRLGYADVLVKMYGRIIAPPEVIDELSVANTPAVVRQTVEERPRWLEIRSPIALLPLNELGAGERAAISLAVELNAFLLINELRGRREAVARGLSITGVIGILEAAADIGLMTDLRSAHADLLAIGFHVPKSMLDKSLARHEVHRKS